MRVCFIFKPKDKNRKEAVIKINIVTCNLRRTKDEWASLQMSRWKHQILSPAVPGDTQPDDTERDDTQLDGTQLDDIQNEVEQLYANGNPQLDATQTEEFTQAHVTALVPNTTVTSSRNRSTVLPYRPSPSPLREHPSVKKNQRVVETIKEHPGESSAVS
jgi:hypothetical protein